MYPIPADFQEGKIDEEEIILDSEESEVVNKLLKNATSLLEVRVNGTDVSAICDWGDEISYMNFKRWKQIS